MLWQINDFIFEFPNDVEARKTCGNYTPQNRLHGSHPHIDEAFVWIWALSILGLFGSCTMIHCTKCVLLFVRFVTFVIRRVGINPGYSFVYLLCMYCINNTNGWLSPQHAYSLHNIELTLSHHTWAKNPEETKHAVTQHCIISWKESMCGNSGRVASRYFDPNAWRKSIRHCHIVWLQQRESASPFIFGINLTWQISIWSEQIRK